MTLKEKYEQTKAQYLQTMQDIDAIKKTLGSRKNEFEISNQLEFANFKFKVLKNNLKIDTVNYFAELAKTILQKYNNKRLGEKTNEKIRNEFIEFGFFVSISIKYDCRYYYISTVDEEKKYSDYRYDSIEASQKTDTIKLERFKFDDTAEFKAHFVDEYIEVSDIETAFKTVNELKIEYNELAKRLSDIENELISKFGVEVDRRY